MSRMCFVCGKKPQTANLVSKANNRVKRWVYPNVHKMRFVLASDCREKVHSASVCTKCVRAEKITKVL